VGEEAAEITQRQEPGAVGAVAEGEDGEMIAVGTAVSQGISGPDADERLQSSSKSGRRAPSYDDWRRRRAKRDLLRGRARRAPPKKSENE
jgi:hypothetical protein